jgi:hypothetical protein
MQKRYVALAMSNQVQEQEQEQEQELVDNTVVRHGLSGRKGTRLKEGREVAVVSRMSQP